MLNLPPRLMLGGILTTIKELPRASPEECGCSRDRDGDGDGDRMGTRMGLRAALPGAGSATTPAALPACVTGLARLRAGLSKCEHTRNQTGTGWDRGQGTGRAAGDRRQQAWSHSGGTGCCWQWHHSPAWAQPSQAAGQPPELGAPLGVGQGVPWARCVLGGQRGARAGAQAVFPPCSLDFAACRIQGALLCPSPSSPGL